LSYGAAGCDLARNKPGTCMPGDRVSVVVTSDRRQTPSVRSRMRIVRAHF